jgi:hypothetical protein
MAVSTEDRPALTDTEVRGLLEAGNTRGALYRARHELDRAAKRLRETDPARAALVDAALAGSLAVIAATLATHQPRKPPGYTGGPPSAADLLAAYTMARNETKRTP